MHASEKYLYPLIFVASLILGLFLIKAFDISYPLTITTTTKSTELAVVGEGKVEATPDTVYIDVGITVNNQSTTEAAQKKIDEVNNAILAAMGKLGIAKADIKTTNYSIYPNYKYENNENRINGYNGNASISIKVSDVKLATQVTTEATKAGANQINGSRFVIDKPEKYREQARNEAITNARQQAETLAKQLGITLGKVTNIVESSPNGVIGPMYAKADMAGAGGGGGAQFEPGTQTISSTVTLYFEKK